MSPQATVTGTPPPPQAGFFQQVHSWLAQPFNTRGSALAWWLTIGLVIIGIGFWQFILIDLTREVKEL